MSRSLITVLQGLQLQVLQPRSPQYAAWGRPPLEGTCTAVATQCSSHHSGRDRSPHCAWLMQPACSAPLAAHALPRSVPRFTMQQCNAPMHLSVPLQCLQILRQGMWCRYLMQQCPQLSTRSVLALCMC